MKMDDALRLAANLAPRPDDILMAAEQLSGPVRGTAGLQPAPLPPPAPLSSPGNLATLRACHSLLSRTVALLE